jgi:roadblock/LC7 domain-containing protein
MGGIQPSRSLRTGFAVGSTTSTLNSKLNYFNWTADSETKQSYPAPNMGVVQWVAKCQSSSTGADIFNAICSTTDGGVVAAGYYSAGGSLTAYNANGTTFSTTLLPFNNGYDSFLVKYSSAGTVQWIAKCQTSVAADDQFNAICSTTDGVVAAGVYPSSSAALTAMNATGTSFSTTLLQSNTGTDPFLVKYTLAGTVQWIAKCQSSNTFADHFKAICSTTDGGVVAAGYYDSAGSSLSAYNATYTAFSTTLLNTNTGIDPFLVKYSSAGVVQWIAKCQTSSQGSGDDYFNTICSTTDGGVVVAGYYDSLNTLTARNADATNFSTTLLVSVTGEDPFMVKYSLAGTVQWIAKCQSSSTSNDRFTSICSTTDGGVVAAGFYTSSGTLTARNADATSFATVLPATSTNQDPFLVKYSSAGTVQWIAKCQSSSTGNDWFNAICSTTDGGVVAAGYYTSTGTLTARNADLTNFATVLPATSTSNDSFLVKYSSTGVVQWIAKCQTSGSISDQFNAICSTSDGGVVAAGVYDTSGNTLTAFHANGIPFGMVLPASNTGNDVFLVKYSAVPGDVQTPPPTGAVQWIAKCQSSGSDQFNGVCSTSDGGIVATGYYNSTGSLTAYNANLTAFTTTLLASTTGNDPFIVKYSSVGAVQWIAKCQSSGNDDILAICSTTDGGVVAAGYYATPSGPLTAKNADGTNFSTTLMASSNGEDPFIVKYNSTGTVQWIAKCKSTSTGNDQFKGICSTSDGGVVACGYYTGSIEAYNATNTAFGTSLSAANNGIDPFLVKYNSGGAVQWIAKCQSNGAVDDLCNSICSTTDGGVVAAGYVDSGFTLTAFNATYTAFGTTLMASGTGVDPFLVKYRSDGVVQWIAKCQSISTVTDVFNAICSTTDGGVVAAGYYNSSNSLTAYNATSTAFTTTLLQTSSGNDPFLVKYSSAGTVQWIAKCQSSSINSDLFNAICSTTDSGIVAAGSYNSTGSLTAYNATYTAFATTLLASTTSDDPFLVKYSSAGTVQWIAKCQSSSTGNDTFSAICSTTDGGVVAAGYYNSAGTLTARNTDGTNFSTTLPATSTSTDPFLVKFY